jgi:simple sugar transport system permease protein
LAAVPFLLAALGGIIAERAGVLNIGLEGLMLSAALVAAWAAASADTEVAGVMAAVGLGLALGLLLGGIMVALRGDQVVVGIAFNILALGLTSYALDVITGRGGLQALSVPSGSVTVRIPGLADIPWIGALFDQHYLAYVAYILVPTIFYLLFRTGLGTRLRACGEFAEGAKATGINVMRWRILAMGASGVLAALAGAYLVLGDIRLFQQNMSGGRGYIALAVIILGRWTPFGALGAAVLFGASVAISFEVQARGIGIPSQVVIAMPYIITLIAIAIAGKRARPPAEEGKRLQLPD